MTNSGKIRYAHELIDDIIDNAKQLLSEETWEYAVQVKIGAKWLFLGRGTGGHNFARNAFWFVKKENAQDYMAIRKDMSAPTRLIRRRVSPAGGHPISDNPPHPHTRRTRSTRTRRTGSHRHS